MAKGKREMPASKDYKQPRNVAKQNTVTSLCVEAKAKYRGKGCFKTLQDAFKAM
jgi:hypothetical protein